MLFVGCRLLEAVRGLGASHDVLPESVREQYGLAGWLDDLQEVHSPTSRESYERACKGFAMRVSAI